MNLHLGGWEQCPANLWGRVVVGYCYSAADPFRVSNPAGEGPATRDSITPLYGRDLTGGRSDACGPGNPAIPEHLLDAFIWEKCPRRTDARRANHNAP